MSDSGKSKSEGEETPNTPQEIVDKKMEANLASIRKNLAKLKKQQG